MQNLLFTIVVLTASGLTNVSNGQSLSEWQKVDGKTGCESIPYSDLQQKCKSYQSVVNSACKGGSRSCDNFDPIRKRKSIETINIKIKSLTKEIEDYGAQKSRQTSDQNTQELDSKIKKCSDDIKDLENTFAKIKSEYTNEQTNIKANVQQGEGCIDSRIAVMKIFKEARDRVDNAINNFDPKSKEIATKYYRHWKEEDYNHETAIYEAKAQVDKCRNKVYDNLQ